MVKGNILYVNIYEHVLRQSIFPQVFKAEGQASLASPAAMETY
jgi:hypothetical protein